MKKLTVTIIMVLILTACGHDYVDVGSVYKRHTDKYSGIDCVKIEHEHRELGNDYDQQLGIFCKKQAPTNAH